MIVLRRINRAYEAAGPGDRGIPPLTCFPFQEFSVVMNIVCAHMMCGEFMLTCGDQTATLESRFSRLPLHGLEISNSNLPA